MTNILILGCSYTQGHTYPYENSWSWILSKRHSHIQFLDYSKGGSSIQWAAHCLDNVDNIDYTIAQYTSPFRLSIWPDEWHTFANLRHSRSSNYECWDTGQLELMCDFASSGWLGTPRYGWPGNSLVKVPFIRDYFTQLPQQIHSINYRAVVKHIHSRVDFGFRWLNRDPVDYPAIEDVIPDFSDHLIDDFSHLDVYGSSLVADWVEREFLRPAGIIE